MLHLNGVSKQYGAKILFQGADAHLGHRSRAALVGPNGAGKSTLIRILLNQEAPDAGTVQRANGLVIGHLAQEVPRFSERSVLEEVMRLDGRREAILAEKEKLEHSLAAGEATGKKADEDLERLGRLLEELEALDEYRLESRAKAILEGMGFKSKDFGRSLTEFSGGWLMRVALSRILLMEPDLLLLDEPTNHLDLESLLWLEDFLKGFRGALLMVSHDTEFLNRVVTEVIEIDQRRLFTYRGNLDAYVRQKEERLTVLRAQYAGQQARIAEIEDFVARFGASATKARQAQSRLKELDRMDKIELPDARERVRFRFPPAPHSGREVITMKKATVAFGTKTVFRDLDWVLMRGSRVAIVGVNGAGKTTLLRLLGDTMEPTSGEVRHGHAVQIGYYAQMQAEQLNMSKTILQELESAAPEMGIAQVRGVAGAFLFTGDAVEKKCGVLSGGEKARVALAKLLLSPCNFLILDEPTNHLDIESRGVLLDALKGFDGTLCIVSHDRAFMGPLVNSVLEIQPSEQGSQVIPLLGTYDDYLARKMREIAAASSAGRSKPSAQPASYAGAQVAAESLAAGDFQKQAPSNNQRRSWERQRERLEVDIAKAEERLKALDIRLGDNGTYSDKETMLKLVEERTKIDIDLSAKLAEWESVCSRLEGGG